MSALSPAPEALAAQLRALPAQLARQWILDLEAFIQTIPGVRLGNAFPLRHTFGDGLYVREIYIPAGYVFTGRIHKYQNPQFLMAGEMLMATEQHGVQHRSEERRVGKGGGARRQR